MHLDILLSFIGTSMLLTIMPGPDIVYVLMQSITFGKKEGILTALGLVVGIILHTSLVAFGVSAIIKQSEQLFWLIKLFGVVYLLYLASQVYVSEAVFQMKKKVNQQGVGAYNLLKKGFIMNVLNPKVTLFFLAFFPGFLFSDSLPNLVQFYILGALFMLQAMLIFTGISIFAGKFTRFIQENDLIQSRIKWIQIIVFIAMAIFLVLD